MKASLCIVLCMVFTVLQAERYYKKKYTVYQTGKLDKDNRETEVSSNVKWEKDHVIELDENTISKPNVPVSVNPPNTITSKNTKCKTKNLNGVNVKETPTTTKRIFGSTDVKRIEADVEDKELTLSNKVREFEKEMRDAVLAKGGDGGYTTNTYYDGNKSTDEYVNESGNLNAPNEKREIEEEDYNTKSVCGCTCGGCKCGGRYDKQKGKDDDKVKGGDGEDGGYGKDVYYGNKVIERDGEIKTGNNVIGRRSRRNKPKKRYSQQPTTKKNIRYGEDAYNPKNAGVKAPRRRSSGVRSKGYIW